MITPSFRCDQDPSSIFIHIHCPAVRAQDVEIHVDDTLVTVHIQPYFLRLNLSDPVVEDDISSAAYDPASGTLVLTLTKQQPGKEFKDLDLLAKLLAPRRSEAPPISPSPLIEVLASDETTADVGDEVDDLAKKTEKLSLERQEILQAAQNDWQLPQAIPTTFPIETTIQKRYGFLNLHSGYFTHVVNTENEINELGPDAESCTIGQRLSKRLEHEDDQWDEEHYIADFADDVYISGLVSWHNPLFSPSADEPFTEEENYTMLHLPRKEYLATSEETRVLYLTLLTLLFAFAYESRVSQNDYTPESAWTMSILTPAFSALNPPPYPHINSSLSSDLVELEATMIASYRRSLVFPLHRSFALAEQCRKDVAQVCKSGKRSIARCLLRMKDVLDHHDVYYVYSKIWLDDFCVWIQAYASDEVLADIGQGVDDLVIQKASLKWDIEELEAAVLQCQARQDSDDDNNTSSEDSSDDDSST